MFTRLNGPRSRPTAAQKNLATPGIEPGTPVLLARHSIMIIIIIIIVIYMHSSPPPFVLHALSIPGRWYSSQSLLSEPQIQYVCVHLK
jgi:hypothetical protein